MKFEAITYNDLDEISRLRPEGWPDIVPVFEYYINTRFCYPVKTILNNAIVGVGASILFDRTGWLAHIIVSRDHRKKGIGYRMVCELLKHFKDGAMDSCLLIATDLGYPVYAKAGFRNVTPYVFLKREKPWPAFPVSGNVVAFKETHRKMVMKLDREVSGENREKLLVSYISNALVYLDRNMVKGYYIPGLGEGLIIADTVKAGLELMKIKYAKADEAILPSDNIAGLRFLKENGFAMFDEKGKRMIFGKEISWKPEKVYSRIGGNFG